MWRRSKKGERSDTGVKERAKENRRCQKGWGDKREVEGVYIVQGCGAGIRL